MKVMKIAQNTLPAIQPIHQSTWLNSPEALLENRLVDELKFHYNHGDINKRNEIESIVIQKIMNTCCSLASQSDDSISFSAELVRQYSPEIINNRNKELAIEIRDARHFDLSLLSQETDYSAKKNNDIKILRDFITKILPEKNIEIELAEKEITPKNPTKKIENTVPSNNFKITEKKTILENPTKDIENTVSSKKIAIDDTSNFGNDVKIEQSEPDYKKESLISKLLSNILAPLYTLFSPHR
ncbi:TPA: hypothetical protein ACPZQN_001838 [Yersinia enterocolitica]